MAVEQVIKWKSSFGDVFNTREEAIQSNIATRLVDIFSSPEDEEFFERAPLRWVALHASEIRDIINEEL